MSEKVNYKSQLTKELKPNIRFLDNVSSAKKMRLSDKLKANLRFLQRTSGQEYPKNDEIYGSSKTVYKGHEGKMEANEVHSTIQRKSKSLTEKWKDNLKFLQKSSKIDDPELTAYVTSRYKEREKMFSSDARFPGSLTSKLEANLKYIDKKPPTDNTQKLTEKWKQNIKFLNGKSIPGDLPSHSVTKTIVIECLNDNKMFPDDPTNKTHGNTSEKQTKYNKTSIQTETFNEKLNSDNCLSNVLDINCSKNEPEVDSHKKSQNESIIHPDSDKQFTQLCPTADPSFTDVGEEINMKQCSYNENNNEENEEIPDLVLDPVAPCITYNIESAHHSDEDLVIFDTIPNSSDTLTMSQTISNKNIDVFPDIKLEDFEKSPTHVNSDTDVCLSHIHYDDWIGTRMQEITNSAISKLFENETDNSVPISVGETSETERSLISTARTAQELVCTDLRIEQMDQENKWVQLRTIVNHYGATQKVYKRLMKMCLQSNFNADMIITLFLDCLCREVGGLDSSQLPNTVCSVSQIAKYCD